MPSAPFWCCCCACGGRALKITIDGVTTHAGRQDFDRGSIDVVGEFVNGDFVIPRTPTQIGYMTRDGVAAMSDPACTFLAATIRPDGSNVLTDYGYGTLREDIYFAVATDGTLDTAKPAAEREFQYCVTGLQALVTKAGDRYLLQIRTGIHKAFIPIDNAYWLLSDDITPGVQSKLIFSAYFDWDGSSVTVSNEVGGDAGETFFSGGTATITCAGTEDTLTIPSEGDPADCAPCSYEIHRVHAYVFCTDGVWTGTEYNFGDPLSPAYVRTFLGATCDSAKALSDAVIAAEIAAGTWLGGPVNSEWRPEAVSPTMGSATQYGYTYGFCVAPDVDGNYDYSSYIDSNRYFEGDGPNPWGGTRLDFADMPGVDVFGSAPKVCSWDKWYPLDPCVTGDPAALPDLYVSQLEAEADPTKAARKVDGVCYSLGDPVTGYPEGGTVVTPEASFPACSDCTGTYLPLTPCDPEDPDAHTNYYADPTDPLLADSPSVVSVRGKCYTVGDPVSSADLPSGYEVVAVDQAFLTCSACLDTNFNCAYEWFYDWNCTDNVAATGVVLNRKACISSDEIAPSDWAILSRSTITVDDGEGGTVDKQIIRYHMWTGGEPCPTTGPEDCPDQDPPDPPTAEQIGLNCSGCDYAAQPATVTLSGQYDFGGSTNVPFTATLSLTGTYTWFGTGPTIPGYGDPGFTLSYETTTTLGTCGWSIHSGGFGYKGTSNTPAGSYSSFSNGAGVYFHDLSVS